MSTLNGIGTKFLGISKPDENGICKATNWLTFFYLPVIPLSSCRIRMLKSEHSGLMHTLKYDFISKEPLSLNEILSTYLFGWILFPLLILGPILLCIKEVAESLGIPTETKGLLNGLTLYNYLFFGALIWMLIVVLQLKRWDEKRGLSK